MEHKICDDLAYGKIDQSKNTNAYYANLCFSCKLDWHYCGQNIDIKNI